MNVKIRKQLIKHYFHWILQYILQFYSQKYLFNIFLHDTIYRQLFTTECLMVVQIAIPVG